MDGNGDKIKIKLDACTDEFTKTLHLINKRHELHYQKDYINICEQIDHCLGKDFKKVPDKALDPEYRNKKINSNFKQLIGEIDKINWPML